MKKELGIILLLLLSINFFVVAQEQPSTAVGAEDVEQIQGIIGNYSPLDESGQVDFDKYKPFKTKADERIEKINLWLTENASWLKIVFGMVPSITWLFAINLYLLLFFFVVLVLNGNVFDLIMSGKRISLIFFETGWGNLLGLTIFIILDVTKIISNLATVLYRFWDIFWKTLLPGGIVIAIIGAIIAIMVFIALLMYAPQVLIAIKKSMDARKEAAAKEKTDINRKALEKIVSGAIQR